MCVYVVDNMYKFITSLPKKIVDMEKINDAIFFIKKNYALMFKFLFVIMVSLMLYYQDFLILLNEAINNEIFSHILAIPFLLVYLIYRVRKYVYAVSFNVDSEIFAGYLRRNELFGSVLCLIAYLMKWYGSYTFIPLEIHMLSFTFFIAGIILFLFNFDTLKALLFPIAYLSFLIPPPINILQPIGASLSVFSSELSYSILKLTGLPVELSKTFGSPIITLVTSTGVNIPFAIDIACSGLYSLIGFLLFSLFISYISYGSIFKKSIVFLLGFPIIYFMNVFRIILIIIIGYFSGPNFALNLFHLLGGWMLIFIGTLILVFFSDKILNISFLRCSLNNCSHLEFNQYENYCMSCGKILNYPNVTILTRDITKYLLLVIIIVPLIFFQVPVFTLTESAAEVLVQKPSGESVISKVLPDMDNYYLNFAYRDADFENIAGQDASLFYNYESRDGSLPTIWVGLEVGSTKGCLHPWEICYITSPEGYGIIPKVVQIDLRDVRLIENPPLTARFFVFHNKESPEGQVILYWYTKSYFQTLDGYYEKWVKISVIRMIRDTDDYLAVEDELIPVGVAIAEYWGPISEWSVISLEIAKNGLTLLTISCTGLLILFVIIRIQDYLKRKLKNEIYNNLLLDDKNLINLINEIDEGLAIEKNILIKYQDITKRKIDLLTLHKKLLDAESMGLIQRKIRSVCNEPYVYWNTNI